MSLEGGEQLAAADRPDLDGPVVAATSNDSAVVSQRYAADSAGVSRKRRRGLPRPALPEPDRPAKAPTGHDVSVVAERDPPAPATVPTEIRYGAPAVNRPDPDRPVP